MCNTNINLEGENIMCSMYEKETMHHVLCIIYYIHYIYIYKYCYKI